MKREFTNEESEIIQLISESESLQTDIQKNGWCFPHYDPNSGLDSFKGWKKNFFLNDSCKSVAPVREEVNNLKSNDKMILCFGVNGQIESVSEKTLSLLKLDNSDLIGKNIFAFSESLGIRNNGLIEEVRQNFHSQSLTELIINEERKWLLWEFEAQLNTDATIGSITATGHEINDFVNSHSNFVQEKNRDYLTGLLNRQGLHEVLALQEGKIDKAASFFIDCWNFSKIVDYYGHHVSDEAILLMANELEKNAGENWLICRYSESQFVLVLQDGESSEESILRMVSNLEKNLISNYNIHEYTFQIDKRIGYAVYPEDTKELSKLVSCSSLAMKESIKLDQISVKRYQKYMSDTLEQNVRLAKKLHEAIETNQVEIYFQKIVDAKSGEVFAFEELARWTDRELGVISPKTMFSIAKEANMIDKLERYLVEKSLGAIQKVSKVFKYRNASLTLNITPASLLDPHFLEFLDNKSNEFGIKPSEICIEVSESTFVNSIDICIKHINDFKNHGYGIAIDDFGREYSSLAILESVSFDIIKIDALFIEKINQAKNQEIIKMIYKIAGMANSKIIAEGVETKNQSEILKQLGCVFQQGYFFNRPDRISTFLE